MMRRIFTLLFLSLCLSAESMSMGHSGDLLRFMPSPLGDARCADSSRYSFFDTAFPGLFDFQLPAGEWSAISITFWMRVTSTNHFPSNINRIPFSQYCPSPIKWTMPDLLSGACAAETGGTNLVGTINVDYSFPNETSPARFDFPRGIYTVVGWTSNSTVIVLGGNSFNVGPGSFKKNYLPGSENGISITGSGLLSIGVSRCFEHEFFGDLINPNNGSAEISLSASITNEIIFCSYRISLSNGQHLFDYRAHKISGETLSFVRTNTIPLNTQTLSSRGMYRFGVGGLGIDMGDWKLEFFDARPVFPRWLSDDELAAIYQNGLEEITRRGIPRWK